MVQNVIYWKFDSNDGTLYIRGEDATGYTAWSIPNSYSYSNVPWYSNRESIISAIIETNIDVTTMAYWFYKCSNFISFNLADNVQINNVTNMNFCFAYCSSFNKSITIPNSVTTIGSCFYSCEAFNQSITIPNSVTNMSFCFYGCEAFNQSITIPDSVTDMAYCFYNCTHFNQSITIPDSVTDMDYCFYNCTHFDQQIIISDNVINMLYCFCKCISFNQSVIIPDSVTDMAYCFKECVSLNKLIIINSDGEYLGLFLGTTLSISISGTSTNLNAIANSYSNVSVGSGIIYWKFDTDTLYIRGENEMGYTIWNIPDSISSYSDVPWYSNRYSIKFVVVETSINVLDMAYWFYYCENLISFTLTNDVTINNVINMYKCFYRCSSFNQPIVIPDSVVYMTECFMNCESFNQQITIPSNVIIMRSCFKNCTSFNSEVTFESLNKVTDMFECFYLCTSFNQSITIPNSVTSMNDCFGNCTSFNQQITIPNNVTNMSGCFKSCLVFNQQIIIPSSVINMMDCFRSCSALNNNIICFNSIPSIYSNIFKNTTKQITITLMGDTACNNYNNWNTYIVSQYSNVSFGDLPNNYNFELGDYKYIYVKSSGGFRIQVLDKTKVTYGSITNSFRINNGTKSVVSMLQCFKDCISFNQLITIPNTVTNMSNCFLGCTSFDQPIIIPEGVTSLEGCFADCESFNQLIAIPNSVINMNGCFAGCEAFNQLIVIPNNVTNMSSCFADCKFFNQPVTIPSKVTDMFGCFNNCQSFNQSITIPSRVYDMEHCFDGCTNLENLITINTSTDNYTNIFANTLKIIRINGTSSYLQDIASPSNVYVYFPLNISTLSIERDENNDNKNAIVTLTVNRFRGGNVDDILTAIQVSSDSKPLYSQYKEVINPGLVDPSEEGWYEIDSNNEYYYLTEDIVVDPEKTYYEASLKWYEAVINPSGNPSSEGWYEFKNGDFVLSIDYSVTDPTKVYYKDALIMGAETQDFITVLKNLNEIKTYEVQVVAVDSYDSSIPQYATIAVSYYTVDFLHGGHGVSFGSKAIMDDLYTELISEPSDWSTNYGDYYVKVNGEYELNNDSTFAVDTFYKKSHDSLFKCDMDAMFRDKNDVVRLLFDFIYPVGSYYETTDGTFDPNIVWGGRWELESQGLVHISAGSTYTAGTSYGANSKNYTPAGSTADVTLSAEQCAVQSHSHTLAHTHPYSKSATTTGSHTLKTSEIPAHTHGKESLTGTFSHANLYSGNATASGIVSRSAGTNGTYTGQSANERTRVTWTIDASHTHDSVGGDGGHTHEITLSSADTSTASAQNTGDTSKAATKAHKHTFTGTQASIDVMQKSVAVYRWHRTE